MKKVYILVAACLMMAATATAQRGEVHSLIKSTDGQPVSGAIISIVGDSVTALSDESGRFALKTSVKNAVVTIKAEGFYPKELPLSFLRKQSGRSTAKITLVPTSEKLYSEAANTYYGSLEYGSKPSTVSSVESKDFTEKLDLASAMGDGVAGLQVIEKSGMPGEGSYMNIRGIHTFVAENNPLIVINGVPYLGSQDVSGVINGYSRDLLFGYDPKDIRSVTVLKGADAAMYGSLGSNGVILVETQQATSDNLETRMTFSGSYGFNLRQQSLPVLNSTQYKNYMKDIGLTRYPTMEALTADYPFLQNGSYPQSYLFNEDTKWMKDIQHTGFTTENLFRVEGGDEIAKYNISFGYTGNQGTLRGTGTDRFHTLISADVLASRQIDIFTNVGLAYITSDLQNMGMVEETNPMLAAYHSMPLINANEKQTDGTVLSNLASYDFWNTSSNPMYAYDNVSNPVALVSTLAAKDKIYDVNTQIGLNFRWNEYLTLTAMANLYYNYTEETLFIPGMTDKAIMPQIYGTGRNKVANGVATLDVNTFTLQGKYSRIFNRVHNLNVFASARMIMKDYEVDISEGYNTASDDYQTMDNTTEAKSSFGSLTEWNYMGFNLHADYTYNNIVRGAVGMALDGTSVSGVDAPRWGFFPSAGVTFMVANLGVLPSWVNKLNVSVEGSLTGNSRFSSNYGKNYYVGGSFFGIGSINRSNMPNTKLEWEKKTQLDVGLDLALFSNKLNIGFTYFTNHAYDLLLNSNVSAVYGTYDYYENCGTINTSGIEASLRVNAFHTKDWDIVLGANIATANSTIKSLGDAQRMVIQYTGYNNDDAEMIMSVGQDPYEFYGYQTNGIYSTTAEARQAGLVNSSGDAYQAGDVRFVDQNNDGIINENDKVSLGSNMPDFYGGINLSVRYRRFVLDANFAYSVGAKVYNATRRELESMDNFYNQSTAVLNRWQVEGQQTSMPRANYGDPLGNNIFSDRWIEDGDYLKLRSVKLSYNFDMLFNFIRSGNIYVAAENLFSLTKYLGNDPEFAYSYSEQLRGFDYSKMPLPITVRIGFNINF